MANSEVASCSIFRDNKKIPDAEVGVGATNAICSRQEAADDVISSYNEETFQDYHAANV